MANAKKTTTAKKPAVAKKTTASAAPKKRGRVCQFAGKKLRKNIPVWPREGTKVGTSFNLIRNGMTYEAYLAAGGRYIDAVDAVKQGHLTIE